MKDIINCFLTKVCVSLLFVEFDKLRLVMGKDCWFSAVTAAEARKTDKQVNFPYNHVVGIEYTSDKFWSNLSFYNNFGLDFVGHKSHEFPEFIVR